MPTPGPILITGASGFVGAHLCLHFLAQGRDVVAAGTPAWRLGAIRQFAETRKGGSFRAAELDLTDAGAVRRTIGELRPSAILNCAAYGAYSSQADPDRVYAVDLDGTRALLEAARSLPDFTAFVQAGTSSEYGFNCAAPSEDALALPDSHYAVAKLAATNLTRFYAMKHGLPAWTLRLYSVYGPLEDGSRLIPKALHAAAGKKLPALAHPEISRDFVFVDDACRAFEAVIERAGSLPKGGIYNIGTGTRTRLRELVELLRERFGIQEEPSWGSMADRSWDHADWYANPAKASRELGWKARTPLAQGLTETASWLEAHPDLAQAALENSVLALKSV